MAPAQDKPFTSTGPHGHRGRMRTRLLANEAALADYEILEMLLFLGIERRDTKPLAKHLINEFGSLGGALRAKPEALALAGVPARAADALSLVAAAAAKLSRPEAIKRTRIGDLVALEAFLDPAARASQPPGSSALLLNNRNQFLGEPDWPTELGPDEIAQKLIIRALDLHATAAILVRNAGMGLAKIGAADRALHEAVQQAGKRFALVVHDTVVLGRGRMACLNQIRH